MVGHGTIGEFYREVWQQFQLDILNDKTVCTRYLPGIQAWGIKFTRDTHRPLHDLLPAMFKYYMSGYSTVDLHLLSDKHYERLYATAVYLKQYK